MPMAHGLWHSIHVVNSIFRKFPGNCTFRGDIKVFITYTVYNCTVSRARTTCLYLKIALVRGLKIETVEC